MNKLPKDIEALEKRIKSLEKKERLAAKQGEENRFVYASKTGFRVSVELLSGVLIGAGLGYILDNFLNTAPLMLVIFLFFGAAAGFLNVYRFVRTEEEKREKENK